MRIMRFIICIHFPPISLVIAKVCTSYVTKGLNVFIILLYRGAKNNILIENSSSGCGNSLIKKQITLFFIHIVIITLRNQLYFIVI
jgi:hypothetical protein